MLIAILVIVVLVAIGLEAFFGFVVIQGYKYYKAKNLSGAYAHAFASTKGRVDISSRSRISGSSDGWTAMKTVSIDRTNASYR